MKKTILAVMILILALILCGCEGVVISIDGVTSGADDTRYAFGLVYEGTDGNVYSESPQGYYAGGTELSAHAVSAEGSAFYCWTAGGYLDDDGATVVSYAKDLTFPLTADTWLYANFKDRDAARVLYHGNGGLTADGQETKWDEFSLVYYLYPNTLPDMGHFFREGYSLLGYNTRPDGSGEFYAPGWKALEDTDAVIELYCVWSQYSPEADFTFTYDRDRGGWVVSGYTGKDETVTVPAYHEGSPVVTIAAGAFTDCDTMKTLVLPATLRSVEDFSCNGCDSLAELHLFDSLEYISDESFDGDSALDTLYFGAATTPRYCNWFNNHAKKVEIMRYWRDDPRPKMICLGGSSTAYSLDAEQLQSLLSEDYLVLNCGTNGANLFNMTSEWAMRFMKQGDFLLQIAEYSAWQFGGVICRWESFRSFESMYNVFSWVPASQYYEFFDSFYNYLDARATQKEQSYEDYVNVTLAPNGYYDNQGTLNTVTRPNGDPNFWQGRKIYFCDWWLYDYMIYYLNTQYAKLEDMGIGRAMAFTPLNPNSLYDYQTDEALEDWERYMAEYLDIPIVSDLQENFFEPAIFFDDDYHLSAEGRAMYTQQLADDMNEFFASAGADAE